MVASVCRRLQTEDEIDNRVTVNSVKYVFRRCGGFTERLLELPNSVKRLTKRTVVRAGDDCSV